MAGFTSGEGCFFVKINKGGNKVGIGVQLVFQVAQHIRDEELMKSLVTSVVGVILFLVIKNEGIFNVQNLTIIIK
jgi:hypothetical protein